MIIKGNRRSGQGAISLNLQKLMHPLHSQRLRRLGTRFRAHGPLKSLGSNGLRQSLRLSPKELSPLDISRLLAKEYDLFAESSPQEMHGGIESAVWSVATRSSKWIVKVFKPSQTAHKLAEDEVRLYDFLNERGLHTPVVRQTNSGASVSTLEIGNHSFPVMLMRMEALRKCSPTDVQPDELSNIARTFARLHRALKDYPHPLLLLISSDDRPVLPTYRQLMESPISAGFSADELARLKRIDRRMTQYGSHPLLTSSLTNAVHHGDLTLENAQLLPDGSVYIFDFADRLCGPVAYGLAITLTHLYAAEDITFERWENLRACLVETYTQEGELTEQDLAALDTFLIRRLLEEIAYLSETAAGRHYDIDASGVLRRYKLGEYLVQRQSGPSRLSSRSALYQRVLWLVGWPICLINILN
jgi:Ser/Thr protein kinase RdoA (MazF antagonist)